MKRMKERVPGIASMPHVDLDISEVTVAARKGRTFYDVLVASSIVSTRHITNYYCLYHHFMCFQYTLC